MHLVTSSQGCQVGSGTRLTYFSSSHSRLLPPPFPSLPHPSVLLLPDSFYRSADFTNRPHWLNLILVDRAALLSGFFVDGQECVCAHVCVCVHACMHECMLGMIKENFLSSFLWFCNPAASSLTGIPAARWLINTHTHGPSNAASEWMFYKRWCIQELIVSS